MNKLEIAGSYLATVQNKEFIIIVKGFAPMLRVLHAFNLSLFIESGEMEDNREVIDMICDNPLDVNYRSLDVGTTISIQEIAPKIGNIEYSNEEFQKWKKSSLHIKRDALISALMLEKSFTFSQAELICQKLYQNAM